MAPKFKNRLVDNQWHELDVLHWFPSRKAIITQIGSFKMNVRLDRTFVRFRRGGKVLIWGKYANLSADSNLEGWERLKSEKQNLH